MHLQSSLNILLYALSISWLYTLTNICIYIYLYIYIFAIALEPISFDRIKVCCSKWKCCTTVNNNKQYTISTGARTKNDTEWFRICVRFFSHTTWSFPLTPFLRGAWWSEIYCTICQRSSYSFLDTQYTIYWSLVTWLYLCSSFKGELTKYSYLSHKWLPTIFTARSDFLFGTQDP